MSRSNFSLTKNNIRVKSVIIILLIITVFYPGCHSQPTRIRVMTWNIWHGGLHGDRAHDFEKDSSNVENTLQVIRAVNPDILLMQETYCCGMEIAKAAGFPYSWRASSNLSIHSKFPITDTLAIFQPFNSQGVKLNVRGKTIICFNIWLHHLPNYKKNAVTLTPDELIAGEQPTRLREINSILAEMDTDLRQADQTPVIIGGDFNSGSHLDWIEATRARHHDLVVSWPVSQAMADHGFKDSVREIYPDPVREPAVTNHILPDTVVADRIDYIYYQGKSLKVIDSQIVKDNPDTGFFNSDHRAVMTVFELK